MKSTVRVKSSLVAADLGKVKMRARSPFALLAAVCALSACSGLAGGEVADSSTRPDEVPAEPARTPVPAGGELPHWTYEGEEGPEHWGELAEDWATCGTGEEQSPIDVTEGTFFVAAPKADPAEDDAPEGEGEADAAHPKETPADAEHSVTTDAAVEEDHGSAEPTATTAVEPTATTAVEPTATTAVEPTATTAAAAAGNDPAEADAEADDDWAGAPAEQEIGFGYHASTYSVVDTGHVVQVNFDDAGAVDIDGVPFTLVQMHFHTPSEHTLGGAAYPVEYHFVHKSEAGELAVFGVIVQSGAENAVLAPVVADLPTDGATIAGTGTIDPADLMPANRTMVRYNGSLTTPPCSEHVRWHLFLTPIQFSPAQIDAITAAYPGSARPTQEVGDRDVIVEIDRITGVEGAEEPTAEADAGAGSGSGH